MLNVNTSLSTLFINDTYLLHCQRTSDWTKSGNIQDIHVETYVDENRGSLVAHRAINSTIEAIRLALLLHPTISNAIRCAMESIRSGVNCSSDYQYINSDNVACPCVIVIDEQ
jgi:hypothetical protein